MVQTGDLPCHGSRVGVQGRHRRDETGVVRVRGQRGEEHGGIQGPERALERLLVQAGVVIRHEDPVEQPALGGPGDLQERARAASGARG